MSGRNNLKPPRTSAEARERGRAGGKASGAARRKKKLLRDCMLELLELPVADGRRYNRLVRLGIDPEDINNRALLTASLFAKAAADGDVAAFKEIRNLIGEDLSPDGAEGSLADLIKGLKDE